MSKQTLSIGINPDFELDYSCLSDANEIVAWYRDYMTLALAVIEFDRWMDRRFG